VSALPDGAKAPRTDALPIETEDTSRLQRWRDELGEVRRETALSKLVPSEDYAASAYRLSLLGLLGDPESAALDGPAADIARLSLRVTFSNDKIDLRGRGGIALMSAGDVRPLVAPAEE
jgi:hypothetical protein